MQVELNTKTGKAILDTHGGELVSYRDIKNIEYIWQGDAAYWSGRNPHLFPIVGELKDGKSQINGQVYEMARHGFARNSEFTVIEQGTDYAVLELRENEETLKKYPFQFQLRVKHELTESGFETSFMIKNTGDEDMPFCIGAHTAFNCAMHEGSHFEDYLLMFDQSEDIPSFVSYPDGRQTAVAGSEKTIPLHHEIFDAIDTLVFEQLNSTGVSLVHHQTGHGVRMDFDGFPIVAFWTKPNSDAPYICIEPWIGHGEESFSTGKFIDKPYLVTLPPQQELSRSYRVSVL
ncbi:aldose 1-epimerase family protein [Oscillospiraceae bacterium PP1C4]